MGHGKVRVCWGLGLLEGMDVALLREQLSALVELGAGPSLGQVGRAFPGWDGGPPTRTRGPVSCPWPAVASLAVNCCCWLVGHLLCTRV